MRTERAEPKFIACWLLGAALVVCMIFFFDLLVVLVGNLVFCLRAKSESESVTPDTAFRFNSKDKKDSMFVVNELAHIFSMLSEG
jgi:hypothetical protein